jgi:threonine dehydratase
VTAIEGVDAATLHEVAELVSPYIRHTPLIPAPAGGHLKVESLQRAGSFKVRGFFAAALSMGRDQAKRGLLTVSAGNAALACAYVARALDVPCRVVMADTAPALKVNGVRDLGAEAVLMPREQMLEWIATRGWENDREVFIHPFANEAVIRGHASIVPEILADLPDVERVLVAVGGGGLICGVAVGFAALKPEVQVVGVQSDGYPLWEQAFAIGGPPSLTPRTIAEGTSAPFDPVMFERLGSLVHDWVVVPETTLRKTVARLAVDVKVVAEGAGSLAYAAMLDGRSTPNTVAILSGGNVDATLLATLLTE